LSDTKGQTDQNKEPAQTKSKEKKMRISPSPVFNRRLLRPGDAKWVEIITLCSCAKTDPQLVDRLLRQVDIANTPGHPADIRMYHHSPINTNLSIHIHWKTKHQAPRESPLGYQLYYALKGLGLLNHSVWTEIGAMDEKGQT
jgi:hypothetical protein